MRVTRLWLALVFLALGVFGVLDATGVVDAGATIGGWWPVAIIGWVVLEMVDNRTVSLGLMIVLGLGLGLLADQQDWSVGSLLWSALFVFVGGWILAGLYRGHRAHRTPPAEVTVEFRDVSRPRPGR